MATALFASWMFPALVTLIAMSFSFGIIREAYRSEFPSTAKHVVELAAMPFAISAAIMSWFAWAIL